MLYKIGMIGILVWFGGCAPIEPPKRQEPLVALPPAPFCKENNVTEELVPQEMEIELPEVTKKVNDLEYYPQTIEPYVAQYDFNQSVPYEIQKHFDENYYRPWSYTAASICTQDAQWPIRAFQGGYGSNLKPVDPQWLNEMSLQSNFQAYSTVNQYAMTTKWMNIRTFPTHKPLYRNPTLPGEGFPFDLLQNSSVGFNEPLFISHYSQDGGWAYVFTNNASGWVESNGIVPVTAAQILSVREKPKVFMTEDRVPLYDKNNRFIVYSRVGMVLPLLREDDHYFYLLFFYPDGNRGELTVPKHAAHVGFHLFNKEDMTKIANQMLRNTYGWGGMFEERDCSSMIREMLTPFGIWLPRNSASQAKKGEVISLKELTNAQKIALIKERGVPFETILYKKGHVLLYIGTFNDTVMVMHNIWGIRTIDPKGQKGRVIIGKAVISTLELGSDVENFDPNTMLLTSLLSMNIFTKEPSLLPVALVKKRGKRAKL